MACSPMVGGGVWLGAEAGVARLARPGGRSGGSLPVRPCFGDEVFEEGRRGVGGKGSAVREIAH